MPHSTVSDPEKAVLSVLQQLRVEVSLQTLLSRLKENGIEDEAAIKAAVWRLIGSNQIEMTPRRTLLVREVAEPTTSLDNGRKNSHPL